MSIRRSKLPNGQIPEMTALDATSRGSVHLGAKTRREEGHQQCIMWNGIHIYLQQIHLSWEPKISKDCIKPISLLRNSPFAFSPSADCHVSLFDRQLPQHQIRHSQRCHSSCPDQYIVQPLVSQPVSRSRKAREYLLGS